MKEIKIGENEDQNGLNAAEHEQKDLRLNQKSNKLNNQVNKTSCHKSGYARPVVGEVFRDLGQPRWLGRLLVPESLPQTYDGLDQKGQRFRTGCQVRLGGMTRQDVQGVGSHPRHRLAADRDKWTNVL